MHVVYVCMYVDAGRKLIVQFDFAHFCTKDDQHDYLTPEFTLQCFKIIFTYVINKYTFHCTLFFSNNEIQNKEFHVLHPKVCFILICVFVTPN